MNPAMTFGFACVGKGDTHLHFPIRTLKMNTKKVTVLTLTVEWKKLPLYWLAQFAGAFGAAACVYGVYFGAKQSSFFFKKIIFRMAHHHGRD